MIKYQVPFNAINLLSWKIQTNNATFCNFSTFEVFWVFLEVKMLEDDVASVSFDVEESATLARNSLLPEKSKKNYKKAYKEFENWCLILFCFIFPL